MSQINHCNHWTEPRQPVFPCMCIVCVASCGYATGRSKVCSLSGSVTRVCGKRKCLGLFESQAAFRTEVEAF